MYHITHIRLIIIESCAIMSYISSLQLDYEFPAVWVASCLSFELVQFFAQCQAYKQHSINV